MPDLNRENWLTEAAHIILDDLLMPRVDYFAPIYTKPPFRVSVGFTGARTSKAIASCFVRAASQDKVNEIFVSPEHNNSLEVLASLTHELVHAIDDCESGHKNFFAKLARAAGLEGKLTATVAGDWLKNWLQQNIIAALGDIPHGKLELAKAKKKQGTRMIKIECHACTFSFRASQTQIAKLPTDALCPACSAAFLKQA
jgi:hypothetical protein